MADCECECGLLGREPVRGGADVADGLAALVRLVTRRARITTATHPHVTAAAPGHAAPAACRRYRIRCSREGVELRATRRQEDEGFESDDDAISQASSDSNGSSCCAPLGLPLALALDERGLPLASAGAGAGSADSANGSGASDNDDDSRPKKQRDRERERERDRDEAHMRELYAFGDVAFCHTDPAFPQVLVLVIKRKKGEPDPSTGLEAVIFQCKSAENVRQVCASYKEFSRRLKMDLQFRYPHRRKDEVNANTLYKNAFNDLQKANASPPPANSPFLKTWITHVSNKPPPQPQPDYPLVPTLGESNKYNLVQRTDDDGVTHIEVSKAALGDYVSSLAATDEYSGSSSIISISTPDVGNLIVSPCGVEAADGEIEGVIRADVDSSPLTDKKHEAPKTVLHETPDPPPQRPQRGVKKNSKQKETRQTEVKSKPVVKERPKAPEPPGTHERVVRGQFVRVNVEQQSAPGARTGHRLFGGELKPGALLSYPAWNEPRQRASRSRQDDRGSGAGRRSGQRRSRSSGPTANATTAHRQPEPAAPSKPLSNRFFGKLKEIANMNNSYVPTLSRRRNSSGDLATATAQFYQYLEPAVKTSSSKSSTNLKSVIKKKNCNDNIEPKKVTFSAYATVQVVD